MRQRVVTAVLSAGFLFLACSPGVASAAPEWFRVYGGEEDRTIGMVRGTSDGGLVAVGAAGERRLWLMKLEATGNLRWERAYETGGGGFSVDEAPDGGFVAVGSSTTSPDFLGVAFATLIGPSGTVRWRKAYGQAGSTRTAIPSGRSATRTSASSGSR